METTTLTPGVNRKRQAWKVMAVFFEYLAVLAALGGFGLVVDLANGGHLTAAVCCGLGAVVLVTLSWALQWLCACRRDRS